jgi:hypothetical protein
MHVMLLGVNVNTELAPMFIKEGQTLCILPVLTTQAAVVPVPAAVVRMD